MPDHKISLVIPAYNEEKYIGDCLEHAIKNSSGNLFEIIVVDNASTDRTSEVARKYAGVKVVYEDKKGLTRARQRGLVEAQGDILAYIDADNRISVSWCETVLKEFKNNPNMVCLSGPCVYYDISQWQQLLVKFFWFILAMPVYLIVRYMVYGGNFVIKRDILHKMGGFDTAIEFYGEDTNIARRTKVFGQVKFKPSFVVYASGRRLAGQGIFKTATLYILNFLSEVLVRKPATKKYIDVR